MSADLFAPLLSSSGDSSSDLPSSSRSVATVSRAMPSSARAFSLTEAPPSHVPSLPFNLQEGVRVGYFLAVLYVSVALLQIVLVITAFITPVITSTAAYQPHIRPVSNSLQISLFNATHTGTMAVSAFSYTETFPLLNITRVYWSESLLETEVVMSNQVGLGFDCAYTVYADVAELSVSWVRGSERLTPKGGDRLTLTTPSCEALNTFRCSLISLTLVTVLSFGILIVQPCVMANVYMFRIRRHGAPPGAIFPPQPISLRNPQEGVIARSLMSPPGRNMWLPRCFTLMVVSVTAFACVGGMLMLALLAAVSGWGLPGVQLGWGVVAIAVMCVVVLAVSVGLTVWEYRIMRQALKANAPDGVIGDVGLFKLSSLACCCHTRAEVSA